AGRAAAGPEPADRRRRDRHGRRAHRGEPRCLRSPAGDRRRCGGGARMRHLLEVDDLTGPELLRILDLSERADLPRVLDGRGAMLLVEKPSARTRTSMEMAVVQLGGHPVTLRDSEIGIDTRESAEDLGRLFSRYGAVIGARVFEHDKLRRLAASASRPVVNLLSDDAHPLQPLADPPAIRRALGSREGVAVTYVGDANNVARSLGVACGLVGARF